MTPGARHLTENTYPAGGALIAVCSCLGQVMKMEGLHWDLAVGTFDAATGSHLNVVADALALMNQLAVCLFSSAYCYVL